MPCEIDVTLEALGVTAHRGVFELPVEAWEFQINKVRLLQNVWDTAIKLDDDLGAFAACRFDNTGALFKDAFTCVDVDLGSMFP